jgi:predicted transcriptional regulator
MSEARKSNITLKLDSDLLRRVKILAAQQGTSISAIVAAKLEEAVKDKDEYEKAMKRSLAIMREGWNLGWQKPRSRDELHER